MFGRWTVSFKSGPPLALRNLAFRCNKANMALRPNCDRNGGAFTCAHPVNKAAAFKGRLGDIHACFCPRCPGCRCGWSALVMWIEYAGRIPADDSDGDRQEKNRSAKLMPPRCSVPAPTDYVIRFRLFPMPLPCCHFSAVHGSRSATTDSGHSSPAWSVYCALSAQ